MISSGMAMSATVAGRVMSSPSSMARLRLSLAAASRPERSRRVISGNRTTPIAEPITPKGSW